VFASVLVLDSWPVMALLTAQDAGPAVEALLTRAHASGCQLWMTTVNLGEVWYSLARRESEEAAEAKVRKFLEMCIRVADVDWELTRRAARLKTKYRLSYADCFAAALAQQLRCTVVTGDLGFRQLEKEVRVQWL
jgi:predicted nucleic acid-binding protein